MKSKVEYPKIKSNDDLIRLNKKVCELGEKYGKPVCATCDVHILEEKDALARKILQVGQGYDDETEAPLYFRSTDKMLEEFAYLGEEKAKEIVITNPNAIAAMLEDLQPIPDGFHPPKVENAEQRLRELCYGKLHAVYGENPHKIPLMRLEREIGSIIENHYADLYMLAQMLVQKSLSDGYIVGSRGSVGSSFVAFLSGITEVNSLPAHYVCPKCHKTEFVGYDDEGEPRPQPLDGITQKIGIDLPQRKCPVCGETMQRFGFDIPFETFVGYTSKRHSHCYGYPWHNHTSYRYIYPTPYLAQRPDHHLTSCKVSNSISFHPAIDFSIRTWVIGDRSSPGPAMSTSSSGVAAMPPPVPPRVNAGRTMTG